MFSVGSEEEADALLTLTCPLNYQGEYVAQELVREQTLANLDAFSDRLAAEHAVLVANGQCTCRPVPGPRKR